MTEHTYPEGSAPGPEQDWAINVAWEILDHIKPGVIPDHVRDFICGMMTAKLHLAARHGKLNTEAHERSR